MRAAAIIVAGGRGTRAGAARPKQFEPVAGRPMLSWSIAAFARTPGVERIVIAADPACEGLVREAAGSVEWRLAPAGATRIGSVRNALALVRDFDAALIHDAARPGLRPADAAPLLSALTEADAAAPALPIADALKRADSQNRVEADLVRAGLFRVQTPQAVRLAPYWEALSGVADDAPFDDDLAIARAGGLRTALRPGAARLAKVTYPEDFSMIERLIGPRALLPRIGTGFDAHRFGPGAFVTLCGIKIPHEHGLLGHSDADAAWHALTDALLGAIAAGDIGDHFPPSDPQWRGVSSEIFLRRAAELVAETGGRIENVDLTLICERPRVKPHRDAMRARTAEILNLSVGRVSVKATTTEEMGFTGRREGLAAQAIALVLTPEETHDLL